MKTYLFKIGDVLSPIKIGTITIPTLDGRTAAMSKAQDIFVLDPLNVVDNSTMGNAQVNGPMTKVNPLGDAQGHSLLIAARRLTNEVTHSNVGIPHPMSQGTTQRRNYEWDQEIRRPSGCFVCGKPECHSRYHSDRAGPSQQNMSACFVCGQLGCHTRNHPSIENNSFQNASRTTSEAANQTNWQRCSKQGDRAPPSTSSHRPLSD